MRTVDSLGKDTTINLENIVTKFLREDEAFNRLVMEEPHRYWRLKEIYWGRKFRWLRESDLL